MLYFDTSFIVPYILPEATSNRIQEFLGEHHAEQLTISDWTRVEFFSMLAREVRGGGLAEQAARDADTRFEAAMAQSFTVVLPDRNDFNLCKRYLQRFETGLRVGDALHLAIASNHRVRSVLHARSEIAPCRQITWPAGCRRHTRSGINHSFTPARRPRRGRDRHKYRRLAAPLCRCAAPVRRAAP